MVFWKILSFQISFSCKREQLGWRGSILSSPCKDHMETSLAIYMAAAKPLLRFSVHCWAGEDFEEECGEGEGSLESTKHPVAIPHGLGETWAREALFSLHLKQPLQKQCFCL